MAGDEGSVLAALRRLWGAFVGLFAVFGFANAKARRLKQLKSEAEAAPEDAAREALYLEELGKSECVSRIPCRFAQPFWAYELPHRREIVPGAVF